MLNEAEMYSPPKKKPSWISFLIIGGFSVGMLVMAVKLQSVLDDSFMEEFESGYASSVAETDMAMLNSQLELWKAQSNGRPSPGRDYQSAARTLMDCDQIMEIPQPPEGWEYIFTGGYDGRFKAVKTDEPITAGDDSKLSKPEDAPQYEEDF